MDYATQCNVPKREVGLHTAMQRKRNIERNCNLKTRSVPLAAELRFIVNVYIIATCTGV